MSWSTVLAGSWVGLCSCGVEGNASCLGDEDAPAALVIDSFERLIAESPDHVGHHLIADSVRRVS